MTGVNESVYRKVMSMSFACSECTFKEGILLLNLSHIFSSKQCLTLNYPFFIQARGDEYVWLVSGVASFITTDEQLQ